MIRILASFAAALAACAPSPQETAMNSRSQDPGTAPERSYRTETAGQPSQAATGPVPEPVSAAGNPAPVPPVDSPAQALGRRTLSTAFVRAGADGLLTVELHDGRVLVLRDVVMNRKNYCGEQVSGGKAGARYCGEYAGIAAARPGGAPRPEAPDLARPNPLDSPRNPAEGN